MNMNDTTLGLIRFNGWLSIATKRVLYSEVNGSFDETIYFLEEVPTGGEGFSERRDFDTEDELMNAFMDAVEAIRASV